MIRFPLASAYRGSTSSSQNIDNCNNNNRRDWVFFLVVVVVVDDDDDGMVTSLARLRHFPAAHRSGASAPD